MFDLRYIFDVRRLVAQMSHAEGNPWPRRHRKRRAAIAIAEHSFEAFVLDMAQIPLPTPRPDPEDEAVSKRDWEKSVLRWRREIRDLAANVFAEA